LFGRATKGESLLLFDTLRDFAKEAHEIANVIIDPEDILYISEYQFK
jgi:hypothetical protein